MNNDLILSILFLCYTGMCLGIGALAGAMRRDTDWRNHLAEQSSAEDNHWNTTIRETKSEPSIWN